MQSMTITTDVVGSNPAHGEVYNITVSSTNTTDRHDITEILLKETLNKYKRYSRNDMLTV